MSDATSAIRIGRDGVAVDDPFNRHRAALGAYHADSLDDWATDMANDLAERSDGWLTRRLKEIGRPLVDRFDLVRAAHSLTWEEREQAAGYAFLLAEEDLYLLKGQPDLWPEDSSAMAAQQEQVDRLDDELANVQAERVDSLDEGAYVNRWLSEHGAAAAESIGIQRELAIRREKRRQQTSSIGAAEQATGEFKEIGAGAESDYSHATAAEESFHLWADGATVVEREALTIRPTLEGFRAALGSRRIGRLTARMGPLAGWAEDQGEPWIRHRLGQLGAPDTGLDHAAAAHIVHVEMAYAKADREREDAEREARQLAQVDVDGADRALRRSLWAEGKIKRLTADLDAAIEVGSHPDTWLLDNEDRLVVIAVYLDELELRRQLEIAQRVEHAVLEPSEQILELLGPRPEERTPAGLEWEALVRNVEGTRLAHESAARAGLEPPRRSGAEDRVLQDRIELYRAEAGLPPLAQELDAREIGSGGRSLD